MKSFQERANARTVRRDWIVDHWRAASLLCAVLAVLLATMIGTALERHWTAANAAVLGLH